MKTNFLSIAAIAALTLLSATPTAQPRNGGKTRVRKIFVSVTDKEGLTVTGLSTGDFTLTEGGVTRSVTRVSPANQPMRIALMIDNGDGGAPALTNLRTGIGAFLDALAPDDEVMLVTTGRQVRVRVPPTVDHQKLKDSAATMFADGGGTVLMDGLLEIDERFFKKAENRWPVFVIFTSDGMESSAGAREKEFINWSLALGARGLTAHAMVLRTPKGRDLPEAIGMPGIVAENVAENSSGHYDVMNTTTALPDKMKALAETIARSHRNMSGWYVIDMQTDSNEDKPIDVGVAREGITVRISDRRRGE